MRSVITGITGSTEDEWDLQALHTAVGRILGLSPSELPSSWANQSTQQIIEQALELAKIMYDRREAEFGEDMRQVERLVMLRVIDRQWIHHLTALDELREGIGLRAVGQRNPLVEYKREAFNSFENLLASIQSEIAQMALNVRLASQPTAPRATRFSGADGASSSAGTTSAVRKSTIGRNDPCPCGSGKKYKNCHGRN